MKKVPKVASIHLPIKEVSELAKTVINNWCMWTASTNIHDKECSTK